MSAPVHFAVLLGRDVLCSEAHGFTDRLLDAARLNLDVRTNLFLSMM